MQAKFNAAATSKLAAGSAGPQYPPIGDVPKHRHLSACEVLTWIGYGRAIPKAAYFAPLANVHGATTEAILALLHRSVPDPKPLRCPMYKSERALMKALRSGKLRAFRER